MLAAILLAAGESTRMGRLKALLPWADTTLLEYGIQELSAVADDVVVVLGHAADELAPVVARSGARQVTNPAYREGRATSIARGMALVPIAATAVLIASVDQPRPRALLAALAAAHYSLHGSITRPVYGLTHGHPTIFAAALFGELTEVAEASNGLKGVLRCHAGAIRDVPFDDPAVTLNLNTPEEYAAGRSLSAG